ncbi:uncharacterized protein LOC132351928 isoform X2 [Balaenoptera ricei]|uniref:uncharacterized protein LOC132351928 isoform X2 n=1 Tax=Balaenoptera ricei TaxID=2746895 RepID=UPI0028BE1E1F|nr:uncharacterized protein LOC132351928 isoform X2 [Balaenoptera ricei]XP_059758036.1 uncharacterized protein LOC132351928 isoform X2 [Balaenoptera ricei]
MLPGPQSSRERGAWAPASRHVGAREPRRSGRADGPGRSSAVLAFRVGRETASLSCPSGRTVCVARAPFSSWCSGFTPQEEKRRSASGTSRLEGLSVLGQVSAGRGGCARERAACPVRVHPWAEGSGPSETPGILSKRYLYKDGIHIRDKQTFKGLILGTAALQKRRSLQDKERLHV